MKHLTYDEVTEIINMLRNDDLSIRILGLGILGDDPVVVSALDARRIASDLRSRLGGFSSNSYSRLVDGYREWIVDIRKIYGRLIQHHGLPHFHQL